ncbi:hypothetical protein [Agromyces albus]|uniref:hypothetical protein n=1 Tax=Agromyces albus TaxID=205332 RepID=UPI00277DE19F|nr:hypothetical protein [Agromyces albus]MDQ0574304.1 hypothetical protein [Agromyces albus]
MATSDEITKNLLSDAMRNPPFTRFVMEHRPVREVLSRYGRLLIAPIVETKSLSALDRHAAELTHAIDSVRPIPPTLGAGGAGSYVEAHHWGRRQANGISPVVTRFWFRRQVIGAAGFLSTWPTGTTLEPIDRDAVHPYVGEGDPVWKVEAVHDGDDTPFALYTPIDLTSEELDLVDRGGIVLQEIYDKREAAMRPILDAIVAEMSSYFEIALPEQILSAIDSRRTQLQAFEKVMTSVKFPDDWKLSDPTVEVTTPSGDIVETRPTNVILRDRLATASFEDLQRSIRVWANAVERYPSAFNGLEEDRISDLLAATLNASLPGADREVFSRRGKTDIQVRAKAIDDGSSEALIFITETKFAKSESVVVKALDPQLFSYLNTADTAAVLLLLFRQKNRDRAYAKYLPPLRAVRGFKGEGDSSVSGWRINRYKRDGKELRLLVATVHIPPA